MVQVSVTVAARDGVLLAPMGLATPHLGVSDFAVSGGDWREVTEASTGQPAAVITARDNPITLTYRYDAQAAAPYPDRMFVANNSRFTRTADTLADTAIGLGGLADIVSHVAGLFDYGHASGTFYQDTDHVPEVCGLTKGSCVDINLYLIAMLRAAGIQAGYVTGYFFPEEKGGVTCNDMHCWVVTRHDGITQEWDIAHHLKMGTRDVCAALDPKPGHRVPLAHSMGLSFPDLGLHDLKLISEPMWVRNGTLERTPLDIRCTR